MMANMGQVRDSKKHVFKVAKKLSDVDVVIRPLKQFIMSSERNMART